MGIKVPLTNRLLSSKSLNVLAFIVSLFQFMGLLVFAINRFSHFDAGIDYAIFNQATYLIGHGHPNPYNTLYNDRFWQDQFNLLAWVIGGIRTIFPSSLTLLVIQAGAISMTSFVVVRFAIKSCDQRDYPKWLRVGVVFGISSLVFTSPWAYEANFFDFHMEPIFTLTLALSLYGFYFNKKRLGYAMIVVSLLAAVATTVFVVGMGIGMIVVKRLRQSGVVLAVLGLVWFLVANVLNAHQSTTFAATYGYLAHNSSTSPSLVSIFEGMITHPGTPISVLNARRGPIAQIFEFSGFLGVFFPPSGLAALTAILTNGLANTPAFIALAQGFQNYPEVILLTMGTVVVVLKLFRFIGNRYESKVSLEVLGKGLGTLTALVAVVLLVVAVNIDIGIPPFWLRVTPAVAKTLGRYYPSRNVEVISTMNVVGRYASRGLIYAWFGDPQSFPICANKQVVVLVGNQYTLPVQNKVVLAESAALKKVHWAKLVASGNQTWIFLLSLPRGSTLTFPGVTDKNGLSGFTCYN